MDISTISLVPTISYGGETLDTRLHVRFDRFSVHLCNASRPWPEVKCRLRSTYLPNLPYEGLCQPDYSAYLRYLDMLRCSFDHIMGPFLSFEAFLRDE